MHSFEYSCGQKGYNAGGYTPHRNTAHMRKMKLAMQKLQAIPRVYIQHI